MYSVVIHIDVMLSFCCCYSDNGDQLKKDVLATNTNDEVPIADGQSSVSPHLPQEVPEYTFPKHIVFELTQE